MRADTNRPEFWSDSYHGHTIATLNHGSGWLVYLDHVLQHNMLFVTAEAAVTWLRQRVDVVGHHRTSETLS